MYNNTNDTIVQSWKSQSDRSFHRS